MTFLFHYILYSGGERNQRQRYRGKPESEEEERRQSSHKIKKTSGFTVFVDENTMAHPTKESCCFLRGTFCWANEIEARSSTSFTVTCCFLAPSVPETVQDAVWYRTVPRRRPCSSKFITVDAHRTRAPRNLFLFMRAKKVFSCVFAILPIENAEVSTEFPNT